jgi:hypothetical protein
VRDQARQIAATVASSLLAYATAARALASRAGNALVSFFEAAMLIIEDIGSRFMSVPI